MAEPEKWTPFPSRRPRPAHQSSDAMYETHGERRDDTYSNSGCPVETVPCLDAGFGDGSMILLTARKVDILQRPVFPVEKISFIHVPNFNEDEAIAILLKVPSQSL